MSRSFLLVIAAIALAAGSFAASRQPSTFPPRLEQYLIRTVGLSQSERARLARGEPVTKTLDVADSTKEVAVFGAVWIEAPVRRYVEAVKDIEKLESGRGINITRRISNPPRLEDFAALRLSAEDVDDLRTCRVGDCDLKLSERALERIRTTINWESPTAHDDVNALMQQLALEYVTSYLEGGNERLAVYRDNSRPTFVAREFEAMVDEMPELTSYMPELRRYLLDFPNATLPGSTSFLYWQEVDFGLKPTIRISHLTIRENPDDTVVVSKMLYASHYFWTGLELRALLPDASRDGFWFVMVNRSRSDGLSGFKGFFVRRRVRSEVARGMLAVLQHTKRRLEAPQ